MIEVFLPVVGFEGIYEVSTFGTVRHGTRILKEDKHWKGYRRIRLFKKGQRTGAFIHRVVATAFIPNPENKEIVNHKNRIKGENGLYNLEWATASENMDHYYACIKLENDNF